MSFELLGTEKVNVEAPIVSYNERQRAYRIKSVIATIYKHDANGEIELQKLIAKLCLEGNTKRMVTEYINILALNDMLYFFDKDAVKWVKVGNKPKEDLK